MNTYSFVLDHKKITLAPIQPSQLLKPNEAPQKDILLSSLLKAECHEFEPFKEWLLLGVEETESNKRSHPLLIPLLQTFATPRLNPLKNHPTQDWPYPWLHPPKQTDLSNEPPRNPRDLKTCR